MLCAYKECGVDDILTLQIGLFLIVAYIIWFLYVRLLFGLELVWFFVFSGHLRSSLSASVGCGLLSMLFFLFCIMRLCLFVACYDSPHHFTSFLFAFCFIATFFFFLFVLLVWNLGVCAAGWYRVLFQGARRRERRLEECVGQRESEGWLVISKRGGGC